MPGNDGKKPCYGCTAESGRHLACHQDCAVYLKRKAEKDAGKDGNEEMIADFQSASYWRRVKAANVNKKKVRKRRR